MKTRPTHGDETVLVIVTMPDMATGTIALGSPAVASNPCDGPNPPQSCDPPDPIEPCDLNPSLPGCTEPDPEPGSCEITNTTEPAMLDPVRVGQTVRVDTGVWTGTDGYSYQWPVGSTLAGTSTSYMPRPVDRGQTLSVWVIAHADCGDVLGLSSPSVMIDYGKQIGIDPVQTISGGATPTVGVPLHVDQGGTWGVGTPTVTFHWRVDKVVVGHGADDTPQPAEAGSRIDVVGHYDRVGYETHAISTVMARAIQPGAAPTLSRAPVLTGAARYAGRSRVLSGTCSLAGERSYQRLRDGTAVKHATKRAYRLRKVDRRHRVTLGVRALRSGYADGSWRLKAVRVR